MILGNYHRIEFKPADTTKELYLFTGNEYKIEVYPLEWYEGQHYETYKGQTFEVNILTEKKTAAEYDNTTIISIINKSLHTHFTATLLKKFNNLNVLRLSGNANLHITDISNNIKLQILWLQETKANITDVSNNPYLRTLWLHFTDSKIETVINNPLINSLYTKGSKTSVEDINQILQDLINNNTPTSQEGIYVYDNYAGIDANLENILSNEPYNWTLVKY